LPDLCAQLFGGAGRPLERGLPVFQVPGDQPIEVGRRLAGLAEVGGDTVAERLRLGARLLEAVADRPVDGNGDLDLVQGGSPPPASTSFTIRINSASSSRRVRRV